MGRVGADTHLLRDGNKWHANRLVKEYQGVVKKEHIGGFQEWQFCMGRQATLGRCRGPGGKKKAT